MKKKLLSVLLCGVMAASVLAGCSKKEPEVQPEPTQVEEKTEEKTDVQAGEIPQDYKYYFSFDEPSDGVKLAVQDSAATPIVQVVDDAPTYVTGVKGNALYIDGSKGAKLDVNGVGDTYTVSFWVNPSRSAQYMPTLQYGPDMHGDATGGQHYVNFTWATWNPNSDVLEYPSVWAYDQNDEAKWPYWYPGNENGLVKQWTNITMTVDPSEVTSDGTLIRAHLYINGEEFVADSEDREVKVVFNTMQASDNFDFLLGINYWDAIFKGAFDEIYVYDYVLNAEQVKALYAAGDASAKYEEPSHEVVVTADPNALETIGNLDLNMPFWSDFSSAIELPDGVAKIVKLKNYSSGAANWNNYVMAFTNMPHDKGVDPNTVEGNKEFAVVRADAWGWNADGDSATLTDVFQFNYDIGNWGTWLSQVMTDADVTLTLKREGDTINIVADNVDFNGTSNVITSTVKTSMTADDDCYLTILGECCYIELLSVEDAIVVTPVADAVDTIGKTDFTNGWWTDWAAPVELANGATKKVHLKNWSDGVNNWDNYVIMFTNEATEAHQNPNSDGAGSENHVEYAALRADAYGWDDATFAYETSWGDDWASWLDAMKAADVTLEISRNDNVIVVDAVIVDRNGKEFTSKSTVTSNVMTADDPCYFLITCEECYIDILSIE
jgi:hypothetical protein